MRPLLLVPLILGGCPHSTQSPQPIPASTADPVEAALRAGALAVSDAGDTVVDLVAGFLVLVGADHAAADLAKWHDPDAVCGRAIVGGLFTAAADGVEDARDAAPAIPAGRLDLSACSGIDGIGIPPAVVAVVDRAIGTVDASLELADVCAKDPQGATYGYGALTWVRSVVDGMAGQIPVTLTWERQPLDAASYCGASDVGSTGDVSP